MNVTVFLTAAVVGIFSMTPAFAGEHMHMHVNHDHEHTRYQPPTGDQGGPAQNTSAHSPQDGKQNLPGNQ